MDSSLGGPVASRLRRPSWRDPRLMIGIGLVASSVALGSWLVSAAQATTGVYVARRTLVPGEAIGTDQLVVAQVRLDPAQAGRYVAADVGLPVDAVALRVVASGELVPRDALAATADVDVRPVPISLETEPAAGVVAGSLVDVWAVPPQPSAQGATDGAGARSSTPALLAERLTVAQVARPSGSFAVGGRTVVHVLVPIHALPGVLAALSSDGTMQVMLVPGTGG
ncbi:MAG TPA: SAF domain-containing protein [Cellulomonadaceae bacterium]|nr:SAF domain-containing protein [Cellulomonadaceae bacterium]